MNFSHCYKLRLSKICKNWESGKCPLAPFGYPYSLRRPQPRDFGDAIVPEWARRNLVTLMYILYLLYLFILYIYIYIYMCVCVCIFLFHGSVTLRALLTRSAVRSGRNPLPMFISD